MRRTEKRDLTFISSAKNIKSTPVQKTTPFNIQIRERERDRERERERERERVTDNCLKGTENN